MATSFHVGDVVVARVTAQGMTKGERYLVTDLRQQVTPFGSLVTYWLQGGHRLPGDELGAVGEER